MLLDKLDYVIAVAEEQNITRAANKLFISQPSLTEYLNRLEDDLGVKLFDRSKSPITVTEAGRHFINEMKKISQSEKNLRSELQYITKARETLHVGTSAACSQYWIPGTLRIFYEKFPDINVDITQDTDANITELIQEGSIDIAIGALPQSFASLENLELDSFCMASVVLVANKNFNLVPEKFHAENSIENPYIIKPEVLQNLPFIAPSVTNDLCESYSRILKEHSIRPSHVTTVSDHFTGLRLAVAGVGIQLIYRIIIKQHSVSNIEQLDFLLLEKMISKRSCSACYRRDNKKIEYIKEFSNIIKTDFLPHYNETTLQ